VVNVLSVLDINPNVSCGGQKASAVMQLPIRGELKINSKFVFQVPCFAPCAVTKITPGRYLVFLKTREGILGGVNWHFSYRPMTKETTTWYKDETTIALNEQKTSDVVEDVQHIINVSMI
jgi:hypothetical protein